MEPWLLTANNISLSGVNRRVLHFCSDHFITQITGPDHSRLMYATSPYLISNLFGIALGGSVLSSECRRVLDVIMWCKLLAMPVPCHSSNSYSTR